MEERRVSDAAGAGAGAARRSDRREVRIVADAEELTRAAAAEVAAALARRGDSQFLAATAGAAGATSATSAPSAPSAGVAAPFPTFALAGGSTPRALYRLLVDPAAPFRGEIDWQAVHFFWGDERHVPPDHPDSNYRMAREAMLDHVQVPAAHVHRIAAEEPDAARAARRYERELIDAFALRPDRDCWPRFDLVLLGLGEEGHTASLFPGSPLLARDAPPPTAPAASEHPPGLGLAAAVWVEKLQAWRITLTPPVLNHAATVIFLVSGAAKAPALAAVLEGEPRPELYPAQVVAPIDGRLLWLVDRAAAAQLRSRP
jgi:6-phosphogluconolactonase